MTRYYLVSIFILLALVFSYTDASCMTTLYSSDVLYRDVRLLDGGPGTIFSKWFPKNNAADIYFDGSNLFIQREAGQTSNFVDLGTGSDVVSKYNIDYTGIPQFVYYTIHYIDGTLNLAKNFTARTWQPFDSTQLAPLLNPSIDNYKISPQVNHIYLIGIHDSGKANDNFHLLAKLTVLELVDDVRISIRWDVLRADQETAPSTYACWNKGDSGDEPGPIPSTNTYYNVPKWIRVGVIMLFVAVGVMLVAMVVMGFRMRRHGYREI